MTLSGSGGPFSLQRRLFVFICFAAAWSLEAAVASASGSSDAPVAVTSACPGVVAANGPAGDAIDDFTEHTYAAPFAGVGNFADCQIVRHFGTAIQSLKVTVVGGQADDIGYVGSQLVTDTPPACSRVGAVTNDVDITDQVQVQGDTATLLLRAQENCCCRTGWGEQTEAGRKNARLHWEVSFSGSVRKSPFAAPKANDSTFVVDQGSSLDTACLTRSEGPIVIDIPVRRVVGSSVATLKRNQLLSATATLRLPTFSDHSSAPGSPFNPQRDRVTFNGHVVPGEFLTSAQNAWSLNSFELPIEWVNFPLDPQESGVVVPAMNTLQIDIDTANSSEAWCTARDWAALSFQAVRPAVMAHGFFSDHKIWNTLWVPRLDGLGIPNDGTLDLGAADSMEHNAAKLGGRIAADRLRWGVDKVNLVCHSKGGLDGRHYAESHDTVDQLLQLATPNGGTPLADVAQSTLFSLLGPLGSLVVNLLVGPAGIQLTTPYMATYNLLHGRNSSVTYSAVAGAYDPHCFFLNIFCHPIERVLLAITGFGDTIVPVVSVHTLRYTQDGLFTSKGDNKEATHPGLHDSSAVFDRFSAPVRMFGRGLLAPRDDVPAGRTVATGGVLAEGEVRTHVVPVDQSGLVFFSLFYPAGDAELALVSPSGQRIDPSSVGDPNISYENGDILGGRLAAYALEQAATGNWTVEVRALAVDPATPLAYAVNAWIPSPTLQLAGSLANPAIHAGEPLVVFGTLTRNGLPLSGAAVTARIGLPDGGFRDIGLHDDGQSPDGTAGDGIYSGSFAETSQPGFYRIAFAATGGSSGVAFSREDFGLATASASRSTVVGYRDSGEDSDGDGLFDALVVDVTLEVTDAARYRLFAVLTDSAGHRHEVGTVGDLAPGLQNLQARFGGEEIFADGVDGPYTLAEVRLAEEGSENELLPVAAATNAHLTAAYSFRDFEHSPIRLTGEGRAIGIDSNNNGLFDSLQVSLGVDVDRSDSYAWSAQLRDSQGTGLGIASGAAALTAGTNELQLTFDGTRIGRNNVNGPYALTDVAVFGAGTHAESAHAFDTPAFLAAQFEGSPDTTPPSITVSLTPNVLWPPNHKMIQVQAHVVVSDNRDPTPSVELVSITSSEPANGQGDGNTDPDVQGADFGHDDRTFLLRAERGGAGVGRVYVITYRARDLSGNVSLATATVTVPHNM